MLMISSPPSKDIDWQTGLKMKALQFIVSKKPISSTETNID
jgi:hypothetical protein